MPPRQPLPVRAQAKVKRPANKFMLWAAGQRKLLKSELKAADGAAARAAVISTRIPTQSAQAELHKRLAAKKGWAGTATNPWAIPPAPSNAILSTVLGTMWRYCVSDTEKNFYAQLQEAKKRAAGFHVLTK